MDFSSERQSSIENKSNKNTESEVHMYVHIYGTLGNV